MSVEEKVKELKITVVDKTSYRELEEALKLYHEMVADGLLKPRGNKVQTIYNPVVYNSNFH